MNKEMTFDTSELGIAKCPCLRNSLNKDVLRSREAGHIKCSAGPGVDPTRMWQAPARKARLLKAIP
ncbi:hypothetical protein J6590_042495 [Homalodisca vitripennis]|nr:hypothetical protein J6590_042495 [Homalodisca vitripennis]